LIRRDVIDPFHVEVDGIFNLACPASPVAYQKDPIKTVKTSFHGAINMLDLAKRVGARILQASTSEVYGDPEVSPQSERYWGHVNPIGLRSCYDESKRLAETIFFDYHRQHQTEIRIARIFNTYGPRMKKDDGRVISNFIVQALQGEDITVYGDGGQTRSFCYVDDLISGLIKLFFSDSFQGPINLGNPEPISMFDLANEIIDLTNSQSKISLTTLPEDDPKQRQPDISRANDFLNWYPVVPRTEGLLRTINSFKGV
jgi:UDP-glucuronate decarboxylase